MIFMSAGAYDLTVGTSPNGKVSFKVEGTETTTANYGQVVTIDITPNESYAVDSVIVIAFTDWGSAKAPRRSMDIVKDIIVIGSENTWTFTMPDANVEVSVNYVLTKVTIDGVTIEISDIDKKEMTVTTITTTDGKVEIPSEVTIGKTTYTVTEISPGALAGQEVTDLYLPDTEKAITIPTGEINGSVRIHTPLPLLDNYALMESLKENFESMRVSATVTAPNKYWTLSSGVDIVLPDNLTAYIVYLDISTPRIIAIPENELFLKEGRRGIKANNGVLLNGLGSGVYEFIASPGNQASGTIPATSDAKSYKGNQLEPVIEAKNYAAGSYAVLKNNEFHSIKANGSKVKACKAVLRLK